jgi:hypothetical protein
MATVSDKTTLIGHCQICEREIKSSLGRIAHHGYERPGQGYQSASCFGALELAIEVGHDALDRFILGLERRHVDAVALRDRHVAEMLPVPNPDFRRWVLRGRRGDQPPLDIASDAPRYEESRQRYLAELEAGVAQAAFDLTYQQTRRAAWVPKDLEVVSEEIVRRTAAEKSAQKAIVDAKRAERDAKERAKAEKLAAEMAVPCERAIDAEGRELYCWSHGYKTDAKHYRHLERKVTGNDCYAKEYYLKKGSRW